MTTEHPAFALLTPFFFLRAGLLISALSGYNHHLITRSQYLELVTVVILSAFIPTLIAQLLFQPEIVDEEEEEALGTEDVAVIHRRHGAHGLPLTRSDG